MSRIAVRLHIDHAVRPIDVAPSDQMQRRLVAPIRAVKIKCVLASLPIVADEPLFVDVGEVTLAARVAGKIEHVPYEHCPQIPAAAQRIPGRFMIQILKFLRMRSAVRIDRTARGVIGVLGQRRPGAIFGDGDRQCGMARMRLFQHRAKIGRIARSTSQNTGCSRPYR